MRAFVALDLDAANRNLLASWLRQAIVAERAVRWTPSEQLHLTVQFLGDVPTETLARLRDLLEARLRQWSPFELMPQDLRLLGSPTRVVYLAFCPQPRLQQLAETVRDVSRTCAITSDNKPFLAHLTLGRVRQGSRLDSEAYEALRASLPELRLWQIESLQLKESQLRNQGALHRVIYSIPFS